MSLPRGKVKARLARLPGWARPVALVVVAGVAAVATRTVIASLAELQPTGSLANDVYHKLEVVEDELDQYQVVYVGSSRTRRDFNPEVFDAELAARGVDVASFNLGLPGMEAFGQDYVIRRLLDADTSALRLLIVAPDDLGITLNAESARTDRQVLWHDLRRTILALKAVAETPGGAVEKARWSWNHVNSFLLNLSISGRLANRFNFRIHPKPKRVLGPAKDGYVPNSGHDTPVTKLAPKLAQVEAVESRPPPRPIPIELDYLRSLAEFARARGIAIVFVREPALVPERSRFLRWVAENDPSLPVVDLGDPRADPDLFDPCLYFDAGHLNEEGATLFTEVLAAKLAPMLLDNA